MQCGRVGGRHFSNEKPLSPKDLRAFSMPVDETGSPGDETAVASFGLAIAGCETAVAVGKWYVFSKSGRTF
jgi:hypothetical protein